VIDAKMFGKECASVFPVIRYRSSPAKKPFRIARNGAFRLCGPAASAHP